MMPRSPRQKSATGTYHVMARGINKQEIFHDDEDRRRYLEILEQIRRNFPFTLYAYCIMNNHIHLLIGEVNESISQIMKRIGTRYAIYYNSKYDRTGHLFQDRYKSETVEDETYFLTVARYIHQNPLKAKVIRNIDEYVWSSYGTYLSSRNKRIVEVDTSFVLSFFGTNQDEAQRRFRIFMESTNEDNCLEYEEGGKLTDDELNEELMALLQTSQAEVLSELGRKERNQILRKLKAMEGSSIRQIAKITGLSKNIVTDA